MLAAFSWAVSAISAKTVEVVVGSVSGVFSEVVVVGAAVVVVGA